MSDVIDLEIDLAFHEHMAGLSRSRRRALAASGRCINGEKHAVPRIGVRCDWCRDVHRRGLAAVLKNPKYKRPGGDK